MLTAFLRRASGCADHGRQLAAMTAGFYDEIKAGDGTYKCVIVAPRGWPLSQMPVRTDLELCGTLLRGQHGKFEERLSRWSCRRYYVAGEWKESTSKRGQKILNPSTNEVAFTVQGGPDASSQLQPSLYSF